MRPAQQKLAPEDALLLDILENGRPVGDKSKGDERLRITAHTTDIKEGVARVRELLKDFADRDLKDRYTQAIDGVLAGIISDGRLLFTPKGVLERVEAKAADFAALRAWKKLGVTLGGDSDDWLEKLRSRYEAKETETEVDPSLTRVDEFFQDDAL